MKSLIEIEKLVNEGFEKLNLSSDTLINFGLLPKYGVSNDCNTFILVDDGFYYYCYSEDCRVSDTTYEKFVTIDDLLYKVFDSITFRIASDCLSGKLIHTEHSRINLFNHQIVLMRKINPLFGKRCFDNFKYFLRAQPDEYKYLEDGTKPN